MSRPPASAAFMSVHVRLPAATSPCRVLVPSSSTIAVQRTSTPSLILWLADCEAWPLQGACPSRPAAMCAHEQPFSLTHDVTNSTALLPDAGQKCYRIAQEHGPHLPWACPNYPNTATCSLQPAAAAGSPSCAPVPVPVQISLVHHCSALLSPQALVVPHVQAALKQQVGAARGIAL